MNIDDLEEALKQLYSSGRGFGVTKLKVEGWCSPEAKAVRALKQWCLGACVSVSARKATKERTIVS